MISYMFEALYHWKEERSARKTDGTKCDFEGRPVGSKTTAIDLFAKFDSGDVSLEIHPLLGIPSFVNNEAIREVNDKESARPAPL
ncbi:unnamed protein product [Bursaphelenchus okinawaensis]|uniref:Uncharacterized protein n=1 Tax=Bursaphelenchus okinawaensis TaxID=465554 RepID=A0A811K9N0_9BILA|nr:unnamed protein product [Bursaphelenchus okinawaensis]CAG9098078.1 unnamed protein product [Bursaphelenchus okinawaensis]